MIESAIWLALLWLVLGTAQLLLIYYVGKPGGSVRQILEQAWRRDPWVLVLFVLTWPDLTLAIYRVWAERKER